MKLVLKNIAGSSNKIRIENKNNIGRVTFNKIAKVGSVRLASLADVDTSGQQNGDVLVYNSATDTYIVQTLPRIDGGTF